jgi:molybdopterin-guanine dinucleotide biosynthesis protein A
VNKRGNELKNQITGVILAGGMARRMGGQDKGLIQVAGKPLIEHVIGGLQPQVGTLIININRNLDRYKVYGLPLVVDSISGYHGPLVGMASCLCVVDKEFMATVPCDSPRLPHDLVQRLYRGLLREHAEISVAHDGEYIQPVFALMKTSLLNSLLDFLDRGKRKISDWYDEHKLATVDFSDVPEAFININTPEDVGQLEAELEKR